MILVALIISFKDLLVTPILLAILFPMIKKIIRKNNKSKTLQKYFFTALYIRFFAVIAFTLIHEFMYGGDTVNYFKNGSYYIWEAFLDNPLTALRIIFTEKTIGDYETYQYSSRMIFDVNGKEGIIMRISGFIGMFTFHTYTANALVFSLFCMSGLWKTFKVFIHLYPALHKKFAFAFLYVPSVVFWGSGLIKDPITLGALGWLFSGFFYVFVLKRNLLPNIIIILISSYIIYHIKVYILLAFLPSAIFWIFNENSAIIKNPMLKYLAKPLMLGLGMIGAGFGASTLTEGDAQYDLDKIGERSTINYNYLTTYVKTGSAYDIGAFDGTLNSALKVGPQAIVVSLFRPFLWEAKSPVMLLSALEGILFIYFTLQIMLKGGVMRFFLLIFSNPTISFCMLFSLIFAFAVGTNSGNFGTLVRYKIPLMPFYLAGIFIMGKDFRFKNFKN